MFDKTIHPPGTGKHQCTSPTPQSLRSGTGTSTYEIKLSSSSSSSLSWSEPRHEKTCLCYANNKGADQPAHPRSLISAFVFAAIDSIIHLVSISGNSSNYLASVAAQAGFCLTWSQTPKTGFLLTRLKTESHAFMIIHLNTGDFFFSLK